MKEGHPYRKCLFCSGFGTDAHYGLVSGQNRANTRPQARGGNIVPKFEPLMMWAVREAGERLNDLMQVIVLESDALARDVSLGENARRRATMIEEAARRAVTVNRTFFGLSDDGQGRDAQEKPELPDSRPTDANKAVNLSKIIFGLSEPVGTGEVTPAAEKTERPTGTDPDDNPPR